MLALAAFASVVSLWAYYSRNYVGMHYDPLGIAVASGNVDRVKELVESRKRAPNVYTLEAAIRHNQLNVLKYLIGEFGIPIDSKGIRLKTPLMYASEYMRPDAVAYLLSQGADPNLRNKDGSTAINVATRTLLTHHPQRREIQQHLRIEVVKLLLGAGADIESATEDPLSGTPLHNAVYWQDIKLAAFLLEAGADPMNVHKGRRAVLAFARNLEMARLLLAHGAEINNAENENQESPLQSIVRASAEEDLIEYLLEYGADICHRDVAGATVVDHAKRNWTDDRDAIIALVVGRFEEAGC